MQNKLGFLYKEIPSSRTLLEEKNMYVYILNINIPTGATFTVTPVTISLFNREVAHYVFFSHNISHLVI